MNHPGQVARPTSRNAILSLVFGILGWMACPVIGSVVAVILGHMSRAEIRRSGGTMDGDGMALVGLILGWSNLILSFLLIVGYVVILLFFAGILATAGH
ncbi:MAG: DUF4190 domain-containing protein [Ahniella sp.]|nr:DUF4190 domain-containing protein [Ahniella sp.]